MFVASAARRGSESLTGQRYRSPRCRQAKLARDAAPAAALAAQDARLAVGGVILPAKGEKPASGQFCGSVQPIRTRGPPGRPRGGQWTRRVLRRGRSLPAPAADAKEKRRSKTSFVEGFALTEAH